MAFANGTASRRLEALKIVVRVEQLKEKKDRTLTIDDVLGAAEKVDKWLRTLPS